MRLIADFWLKSRKEVGAERERIRERVKKQLLEQSFCSGTNKLTELYAQMFDTDTTLKYRDTTDEQCTKNKQKYTWN